MTATESNKRGTLFGVSLGPGDPDLITRRAWSLLQSNTIWTYPIRNKKSTSYALAITERAGLSLPSEHSALIFPMTHDKTLLAKYWLRAAGTVRHMLQQGKDVLFLVEGDASTYSTLGHLARTLKAIDNTVTIETIAGVTSYNAAAARLQQPLADVDDTVAIIPAGYGIATIEQHLKNFDTLVLLKVKPLLDDIITLLQRHNLLQHSFFIEKVGAPDERYVHDLLTLRNTRVNYLSLMIVRNPQRIRGEMIRGCRSRQSANKSSNPAAIEESI